MTVHPSVANVPDAAETSAATTPPVVQVVARLDLLGQTVAAALRSRGLEVTSASPEPGPGRAVPGDGAGVLLLIDDLETADDVRRALRLLSASRAPSLVLTQRPRGGYWGALLAAGAAEVMSAFSSLDEVDAALGVLATAGGCGDPLAHDELVREWDRFVQDHAALTTRLASLTRAESAVLEGLCSGAPLTPVAEQLELEEAGARSHLTSVLGKLEAHSPLAAVALVRHQRSPLAAGVSVLAAVPSRVTT